MTSNHPTQAHFDQMDWTSAGPGIRVKEVSTASVVLRIVELAPPFSEDGWCTTGHSGYVVQGALTIQFDDGTHVYKTGDAFHIPAGMACRHRALVRETVRLFLVDPIE